MNYEYRYRDDDYSIILEKAEEGFRLSFGDENIPLSALRVDDHTSVSYTHLRAHET